MSSSGSEQRVNERRDGAALREENREAQHEEEEHDWRQPPLLPHLQEVPDQSNVRAQSHESSQVERALSGPPTPRTACRVASPGRRLPPSSSTSVVYDPASSRGG